MLRFDKIGRAILVLGLILLFISSFGGLRINLIIPAFFLIIGILLDEPKKMSNQVKGAFKKPQLFPIMIGCLLLGLFCSSFIILLALANVKWNEIYYFSSDIPSKLLSGNNGLPNFGLLLGLIFSLTLLAILIIDRVILGINPDLKPNTYELIYKE